MRPRMVVLAVLSLAGALAAAEPARPVKAPLPETRAEFEARLEKEAKSFGVSAAELKRLRAFGFADSEIETQIKDNKRTARQLITEREVVDALAKAVADLNERVYKLPPSKQASERERGMRDAIAKVRREHRTGREEFRQILSKTSFLRDDELKRVVR